MLVQMNNICRVLAIRSVEEKKAATHSEFIILQTNRNGKISSIFALMRAQRVIFASA